MARKLKTFTTSIGFFDLAVAAPSMKAALEAWGSGPNLFKRGFAQETSDPAIVAATMAHPGVVLRRAVGTDSKFTEHADLPKNLASDTLKRAPTTRGNSAKKDRGEAGEPDAKTQKAAIIQFEKEKARRDKQRARDEAERRKAAESEEREEQRRQIAVQKAEAFLEQARERHETAVRALEARKSRIDERLEAERRRWRAEEEKLEAKIREARG